MVKTIYSLPQKNVQDFFLLEFTPWKAEQPTWDVELQEKEAQLNIKAYIKSV